MAKPAFITLEPVVTGDTWDGLTNCRFSSTGSAFGSTLSKVRLDFKSSAGVVGQQLTTVGSGGITIDNATNWTFTVDPVVITMSAGMWSLDFETTDSAGIIKTRVAGIIEILSTSTD
jgi:hypothetical protein